MKTRKLLIVIIMALMLIGVMAAMSFAGGGAIYLYPEYNKTDGTFYENCSSGIKEWKEGACEEYTLVTKSDTTWGETGKTKWYVATDTIEIENTVTIQGDVRLVLCDGAKLTIISSTGAGIDNYGEGNSLTIYAQSTGNSMGILTATGGKCSITECCAGYAGIRSAGGATLAINGGDVAAYGGSYNQYCGAGIGGNSGESGSNITINGGKVTADNDENASLAAGIGGGSDGNGEYITINGGTVIAGNENFLGAGIGGGNNANPGTEHTTGSGSYITINGGDVTAKSKSGSGIGSGGNGYTSSYITINGGIVDALGVVGIGGNVSSAYGKDYVSAHDIVISGGTVTASVTSGDGAAIGGIGVAEIDYNSLDEYGVYASKAIPAKVYNITISGSGTMVTAKANKKAAGIGGGSFCSAENITIKDGATVIATGGEYASGIGAGGAANVTNAEVGTFSNASNITISGEGTTVIATGGQYGAGIGAGEYGIASNITITDGAKVYATTTQGSAIGAGLRGSADGITISDGAEVVAMALGADAAIGARNNASNIIIDNATVTAKSGVGGTAIGSAKGTASNIVIKGEDTVVTAISSPGASNSGSAIGAGEDGSATGIKVDASLLMVQNDDEILTDDMEICKDRTSEEDVSATVCNKNMPVIVIKPRDAYVAQVGTGDNAKKYYFVQTAIEKILKELSINKVGVSYYVDETASSNYKVNQSVELDNITITMIADSSEEIDIPYIKAGIYLEDWCMYSSEFGDYVYFCQNITLDLNGHVLSAFFDSGESAVTIGKNQSLTLIDSNPDAEHQFTVDENGLYGWDEDFASQVSSRLKIDKDGNYYWDDEAAIVTIKGACITGTHPGIVELNDVDKKEFVPKAIIAGVYNEGSFNMYAGTITGNSAYTGGGVYNSGTMTVGGTAVIEGNTVYGTDTAQNLYLTSGTKITIDNLTEGANIGITTATKPTDGSPVEFTTNGAKTDEAYFFSDSLDYADKYYTEGGLLDLILGYRVTAKTSDGGTISVGNQKSAYAGETIIVTATPDEGYELSTLVLSGDGIIATDITDKKSFTMPDRAAIVTASYTKEESGDNFDTLNLENKTGKELVQPYTFKQTSETYKDVTRIKLEWIITDIEATYKSHKTWDPDTLTWVEVKEDVDITNIGASFTITNYSSKTVVANVKFTVDESLKETFTEATFDNNDCSVETPVIQDKTKTYTEAIFDDYAKTITATLKLKKDEFADISATDSAIKYGTYTITIKMQN